MEEAYAWLYNIIESCDKDFHFECADVLISLFSAKYRAPDMVSGLRQLRKAKWDYIHSILV